MIKQQRTKEFDVAQVALKYLAGRDRTSAQIAQYLGRKGASAGHIQSALRRLSKLGYINDRAYALRWAESRLARKPVGRERLKADLLSRGLADDIVEYALGKMYHLQREADLAGQVVRARSGGGEDQKTAGRIARFLKQRGFDEETIQTVMQARGDQEQNTS
ncbi:MAG: regulatory protein RecX [Nitrospiraceae bacterium]